MRQNEIPIKINVLQNESYDEDIHSYKNLDFSWHDNLWYQHPSALISFLIGNNLSPKVAITFTCIILKKKLK